MPTPHLRRPPKWLRESRPPRRTQGEETQQGQRTSSYHPRLLLSACLHRGESAVSNGAFKPRPLHRSGTGRPEGECARSAARAHRNESIRCARSTRGARLCVPSRPKPREPAPLRGLNLSATRPPKQLRGESLKRVRHVKRRLPRQLPSSMSRGAIVPTSPPRWIRQRGWRCPESQVERPPKRRPRRGLKRVRVSKRCSKRPFDTPEILSNSPK